MSGQPSRLSLPAGYALVAIAAASWGTWPLILRAAEKLGAIPASIESALAMAVIAVVSAPFCLRDRVPVRATRAQWLGIAWLGIADALNVGLFFAAYRKTTVAIAVLTHYLTPIFVALAAPLVLGERLRARTMIAVGLASGGLALLLRPWDQGGGPHAWEGALLGAGSAVFYASNVIVTKRIAPAFSASEMMFFHSLVSLPLLLLQVPHGAWATAGAQAMTLVTVCAIGPGALAGLFFVWGLRRVPASHASTLTLLEPLVAVVLAAIVYGEFLGAVGVAGGALILAGAGIVVSARTTPVEL